MGHDCGPDCDIKKGLKDGHPLEQMAGESHNRAMVSVLERLCALEQDNAALKKMVTALLETMPDDARNGAMMAALRKAWEANPIDEALGCSPSVEDR